MSFFIDTCSDDIILALIKDDIIDIKREKNDQDLSTRIMTLVDNLFKKNNIKPIDLKKIYVVNGPGSFTGIRVGVTIAKTMGYCLNIPLIKISKLELLSSSIEGYSMPIIDARRGYVFGAIYNDLNPVIEDKHILLEELKQQGNYQIIEDSKNIDILKVINKHKNDIPVNPHELNPNYLKRTEAEEVYDKKNNSN